MLLCYQTERERGKGKVRDERERGKRGEREEREEREEKEKRDEREERKEERGKVMMRSPEGKDHYIISATLRKENSRTRVNNDDNGSSNLTNDRRGLFYIPQNCPSPLSTTPHPSSLRCVHPEFGLKQLLLHSLSLL